MTWTERPREVANHLNAAYCCSIITAAVGGYTSKEPSGMPLSVAYLVSPLILHGRTAGAMPGTSTARFSNWIYEHRWILGGFQERARLLVPFAREAILLGSSQGLLILDGSRLVADDRFYQRIHKLGGVVSDRATLARRLGIMLASAGSPATIYALLGVAP